MTRQGLYISLIGIDGIGKTTLAGALRDELTARGRPVEMVSWRSALEDGHPGWPRHALRPLWMDTFRLLFGGSLNGGSVLDLPETYDEWASSGAEDRLATTDLTAATPSGPAAAMLVELAGNVVLFCDVIRPLLRRGVIVIQETYPYKHLLKEFLLAHRICHDVGDSALAQSLGAVFECAERTFQALIRPDIGVFIDGAVDLAYRWRMHQTGQLGVLEDHRVAGDPGIESFLDLQSACRTYYVDLAERQGWVRHAVTDAPVDVNTARGLSLVLERIAEVDAQRSVRTGSDRPPG